METKVNKVDYSIFIPARLGINCLEINEHLIKVEEIISVNISLNTDVVDYWLYLELLDKITQSDYVLKRLAEGKLELPVTLLLGNSKYFIEGQLIPIQTMHNPRNISYECKCQFHVINASKTINNIRPPVKVERAELLDLDEE